MEENETCSYKASSLVKWERWINWHWLANFVNKRNAKLATRMARNQNKVNDNPEFIKVEGDPPT